MADDSSGVDLARRALVCGGCALVATACAPSPPLAVDSGDPSDPSDPFDPPDPDDPLSNPDYPCDQPIEPGGEGWTGHSVVQNPELLEVGGWIGSATRSGKLYIVAHVQEGCYVAASRRCTHENVVMDYSPTRGQFVCPRHASVFDWEGNKVGGPAPGPIEVYFAGRDGDTVWVKVTDG